MAVHLNMVSVDGGYGSRIKSVSTSNNGSSRPSISSNPMVEPDYNKPKTSTRSPASSNKYSSSTRSSGASSPSTIKYNKSNSIDYTSLLWNQYKTWVANDNINNSDSFLFKNDDKTTLYNSPTGATTYNSPYLVNNNLSFGSSSSSGYAARYNDPAYIPNYSKKNTDESKVAKASFKWGIADIGENFLDGLMWLSALYADSQIQNTAANSWSLSASQQIAGTATSVRDVAPLVEYDITDVGYKNEMKKEGISDELAYGDVHRKYDAAGKIAGSVALSFIPGGAGSIMSGLTAVGSSTELALQSGATIEETNLVALGAFGFGVASDYGLDHVSNLAKVGTKNVDDLVLYGLKGTGVSMIEPVANSVIEYNTYGKTNHENWWQYYKETGGLTNTIIASAAGLTNTTLSGIIGLYNYNHKIDITDADISVEQSPKSNKADVADDDIIEEVVVNIKYFDEYDSKLDLHNPKYFVDSDPLKPIYPGGDGSQEFVHLSNDEFLGLANGTLKDAKGRTGIDALVALGAERVELDELRTQGGLTRATSKSDPANDGWGKYFGSPSIEGVNDVVHRAVDPKTTKSIYDGKSSIYHMDVGDITGEITIDKAIGVDKFILDANSDYQVVCMKTKVAAWYGLEGGADQYTFYLADNNGNILTRYGSKGDVQTYKLERDALEDLGIIFKGCYDKLELK